MARANHSKGCSSYASELSGIFEYFIVSNPVSCFLKRISLREDKRKKEVKGRCLEHFWSLPLVSCRPCFPYGWFAKPSWELVPGFGKLLVGFLRRDKYRNKLYHYNAIAIISKVWVIWLATLAASLTLVRGMFGVRSIPGGLARVVVFTNRAKCRVMKITFNFDK